MTTPLSHSREKMLADLAASDAEVESGDILPGEAVLRTVQAAINRLEARLASAHPRKIAPRR